MDIDRETLMQMLRRMWMIRNFELKVIEVHSAGEFTGAAHPYIGEEAVAVGACAALNDTDYIAGNHRSHGHPIAKGGRVDKAMAELYGRVDGYCKGKGGSMHMFSVEHKFYGGHGIVGAQVLRSMASNMPFTGGSAGNVARALSQRRGSSRSRSSCATSGRAAFAAASKKALTAGVGR